MIRDHLNHKGAKKVTSYLGEFLADKSEIVDHRGDTAYARRDESLEIYMKKIEMVFEDKVPIAEKKMGKKCNSFFVDIT